mmetsp:Transcript_13891/g.32391  ORF Transcript_13891/g.32391 Transcript_13891/m.32391 type:complete len:515 (+) Transcript_13891:127-1671(+)
MKQTITILFYTMTSSRIGKDNGVLLFLSLWAYCSVHLAIVVEAQTNLFRGYNTGNNANIDGTIEDVPLTTTLSNGVVMPLAGLGVGNLQQNLVETMIHHGLKDNHRLRLLDTSHASGNEREVSRGITTGVKDLKEDLAKKTLKRESGRDQRIQVHVVTKIWYTYLGYERTKLAVDEIIQSFEEAINDPNVDLKLTLLIHWPQCFDAIPWMNCVEEEEQLPDRIRNAGPPPHLDKDAWKGSWRALEDIYESHNSVDSNKNDSFSSVVASIGVSNFDRGTLETLLEISRTPPHISQINVWSLMNDTPLIELMNKHNIHIQVYNVMNGIIGQVYDNPKAHHHLLMVAAQLKQKAMKSISSATTEAGNDDIVEKVFLVQVILKWFVQFDISVIPRTSSHKRLTINSAVSLSKVPDMSHEQMGIAGRSIGALINNQDLKDDILVQVRFHAKESDMFLYWVPDEGDTETQVAFIEKGSSYEESTHPGHTFRVYHAYDPDRFETYSIRGHYGDTKDIHVEL